MRRGKVWNKVWNECSVIVIMKIKEKWILNYYLIERGEVSCEIGFEREDYLLIV